MEETTLADALKRGNPVVFFDVAVAGREIGRVKMELFKDVAPRVGGVCGDGESRRCVRRASCGAVTAFSLVACVLESVC